jgi:hypothetical protein
VNEARSGVLGAKSPGEPPETLDFRTLRAEPGLSSVDPGLPVGVVLPFENPDSVVIEALE